MATVALAVFGFVYELFSHEVYSPFMMFAFVVPLALGVVPALMAGLSGWRLPSRQITTLYGAGVATLAVGSVMRGVLDIYGTTNAKLLAYPVAGVAMVAGAVAWGVATRRGGADAEGGATS